MRRPVIAYGKGGALETVISLENVGRESQVSGNPITGVFFYEQTPEALIKALRLFRENKARFEKSNIRNHAIKFDKAVFKEKTRGVITEKYKELQRTMAC